MTLERPFIARLDVVEFHPSPLQVLFVLVSKPFLTSHTPDKPYVECTTCKKQTPAEAEAIHDVLRIGQEALDKVTALEDSGKILRVARGLRRPILET